jgi:hypothetical protein
VFVGDSGDWTLKVVRASDQRLLWSMDLVSNRVATDGKRLYLSIGSNLEAYDTATGRLLWAVKLGGRGRSAGPRRWPGLRAGERQAVGRTQGLDRRQGGDERTAGRGHECRRRGERPRLRHHRCQPHRGLRGRLTVGIDLGLEHTLFVVSAEMPGVAFSDRSMVGWVDFPTLTLLASTPRGTQVSKVFADESDNGKCIRQGAGGRYLSDILVRRCRESLAIRTPPHRKRKFGMTTRILQRRSVRLVFATASVAAIGFLSFPGSAQAAGSVPAAGSALAIPVDSDPRCAGADWYGTQGADSYYGEARNEELDGRRGADKIWGARGNDRICGSDGNDTTYGGAGNDREYGGKGADTQHGDAGNDYQYGDNDSDTQWGGSGRDYQYGGYGNDVQYGQADVDYQYGGYGNDYQYGGNGNDYQYAQYGDDWQYSGNGNDSLWGGPGKDHIYGNAGNDKIYGGSGEDWCYGGAGSDTFVGCEHVIQ